jgi:hypothetical protein
VRRVPEPVDAGVAGVGGVLGGVPYEATSGWRRKASEAALKGVEVRRD